MLRIITTDNPQTVEHHDKQLIINTSTGELAYDNESTRIPAAGSNSDEGTGQTTASGGEIFNDYVNNVAASYAHAEGHNTKANSVAAHTEGRETEVLAKCYTLASVNSNVLTVDGVSDLVADGVVEKMFVTVFAGGYKYRAIISDVSATTITLQSGHDETREILESGVLVEGLKFLVDGGAYGTSDYDTSSLSISSHAEGARTKAYIASHSEGVDTEARGFGSHAEGRYGIAHGEYSHIEGYRTETWGSGAHAEGNKSKAFGFYAHAEGGATNANGNNSHSEGVTTRAEGSASHVEGTSSVASGAASHAEGNSTIASGANSHAEGRNCHAGDVDTHAEGYGSIAAGDQAHAEGYGTVALGARSHTQGIGTVSGSLTKEIFLEVASYSNASNITLRCDSNEEVLKQVSKNAVIYGTVDYVIANNGEAVQYGTSVRFVRTITSITLASDFVANITLDAPLVTLKANETLDVTNSNISISLSTVPYQNVMGKYNAYDRKGNYANIVGNGTADNSRSNAHTLNWNGTAWFAREVKIGGTGEDTATSRLPSIKKITDISELTSSEFKLGDMAVCTTATFSCTLGEEYTPHGLELYVPTDLKHDGYGENVTIGGRSCRKGGMIENAVNNRNRHMYFNLPGFSENNPSPESFPFSVRFSYYDSGEGTLKIRYAKYPVGSSALINSSEVTLSNTNTWKEAIISIPDAYLTEGKGALAAGQDFRIEYTGSANMYISEVSVHIDANYTENRGQQIIRDVYMLTDDNSNVFENWVKLSGLTEVISTSDNTPVSATYVISNSRGNNSISASEFQAILDTYTNVVIEEGTSFMFSDTYEDTVISVTVPSTCTISGGGTINQMLGHTLLVAGGSLSNISIQGSDRLVFENAVLNNVTLNTIAGPVIINSCQVNNSHLSCSASARNSILIGCTCADLSCYEDCKVNNCNITNLVISSTSLNSVISSNIINAIRVDSPDETLSDTTYIINNMIYSSADSKYTYTNIVTEITL